MTRALSLKTIPSDLVAGVVVFLVALPLCLGVALAAGAPPAAGLLSGIIGGLIVGAISKSHTSVSGPSPAVLGVITAQIVAFGFEGFLIAVLVAGVIQIVLGVLKLGIISIFVPSSVIKGLLAAIGVILILKQLPHVVGHDADPEGEMSFFQPDLENTFSELGAVLVDFHPGAALVGLVALLILAVWEKWPKLNQVLLPAPLAVVGVGIGLQEGLKRFDPRWRIDGDHIVNVPIAKDWAGLGEFVATPDWSQLLNPAVLTAGLVLALVASLETLLNLEAVDKIDPQQRDSPPNRELIAQGAGNMLCGLIGGLPVSSVIVRSSVNINAGAKTRLSAIIHGCLLLISVLLLPVFLNKIPIACLAAILFVTGIKLASPKLVQKTFGEGWNQFLPFAVTIIAIVLTNLVTGVLIGLATSIAFILHSNLQRPLRRTVERHFSGDVLRIELANQVSFLNRAVLWNTLNDVKSGGNVLIDARSTDYIDPDVLSLLQDFKENIGPARGVKVSLLGFKEKYHLEDEIQYVDHADRNVQSRMTPDDVLKLLQRGNTRFQDGRRLTRDLNRQVDATAAGQFPLAVILSCIDSRAPAEIIFDVGIGELFNARVAGNITTSRIVGSIEYGCAVAGAKLLVVMGHTRCGAVTAAIDLLHKGKTALETTGCTNLDAVVSEIQKSIELPTLREYDAWSPDQRQAYIDEIARANVLRTMRALREESPTLERLDDQGGIKIVGGMYDVRTGKMAFLSQPGDMLAVSGSGEWSRT